MSQTSRRPLSPHLQVYKLPMTALLSITHRATGAALTYGSYILILWLGFICMGESSFHFIQHFWSTWIGQLLLIGWTFSLFYHLGNGIRHLFWDVGQGYELDTVCRSGLAVIVFSLIATLMLWGGHIL
jgi:succinate dehydrogenase / fumarate reductase, cytochrome b subunit